MSSLERWLAGRSPRPPAELEEALSAEGDADVQGPEARAEVLGERARARLLRALEEPGRVRESAFELLAADALLTYACEAALEAPDADDQLVHLLRVGAGS